MSLKVARVFKEHSLSILNEIQAANVRLWTESLYEIDITDIQTDKRKKFKKLKKERKEERKERKRRKKGKWGRFKRKGRKERKEEEKVRKMGKIQKETMNDRERNIAKKEINMYLKRKNINIFLGLSS